jgi:hypothetical protein
LIKQALNSPLYTVTSHYGGILRPWVMLVHRLASDATIVDII